MSKPTTTVGIAVEPAFAGIHGRVSKYIEDYHFDADVWASVWPKAEPPVAKRPWWRFW